MNKERQLVYRFLDLNYIRRMQIVQELGLVVVGDEDLSEQDRNACYFRRAQEWSLLGRLWEEVELKHGNYDIYHNPFS